MRDVLNELISTTNVKNIGTKIKKNQALLEWLLSSTTGLVEPVSLTERAYAVINNRNTNTCDISQNKLRFKSFTDGYGFCGMTKSCQCAKISVSNNVKHSKSKCSNEQKIITNISVY